jgi:hypothetical protein
MHIPSGVEIKNWFLENHAKPYYRAQSAEGFDLVREGNEYCYIWMMAYVDMDLSSYFLLEVRTDDGKTETRDFLFVATDYDGNYCEWYNKPHKPFEEKPVDYWPDYFIGAMKWFGEKIIQKQDW